MCGLFGILQHQATTAPSRELLDETARRLHHRGPDAHGFHAAIGVGLVHTRLSLVDLHERSNQPFWDATHRYCLIYNGELYDHADLRARLEQHGVVFRTTSDTEVLLEALIHFGVDETLPQLEGMYAFALYDTERKELTASRDRFGIKPLYIHDGDAAFICSSTVDAMRPWLALRPDVLTMSSYLQGFNGPASGRTFYEHVSIVPPGVIVRVALGGRARFAQRLAMTDLIDPAMIDDLASRPLGELVDRVEHALLRSVASQLEADVPVGAFCSGGVDSSLLMAMAARMHGDLKVFHADVVGSLSERGAAERLAKHLKLEMRTFAVRDDDFVSTIPDVVSHFGLPFAAQPTTVPLMLVSRLVHENGIKAVLTGEGSDECYLGYTWLAPDIRASMRRLPGRFLRALRGKRPPGLGASAADHELTKGLSSQFEVRLGPVTYGGAAPSPGGRAAVARGLATDHELSYILRTLLHRNDSMGMASSIEARFPFLDSRLVKLSVNLPYRSKIRFSPFVLDPDHPFYRDKWVVRQVAARYLPPELTFRRKGAFPTSAFERLRIDSAFFDDSFLAEWLDMGKARLRYLADSVSPFLKLRLLHLDSWGHVCIRGLPKGELSTRLARYATVGSA